MTAKTIDEDVRTILAAGLPWQRLAGKRILVTGAAGFIPSYFVETLLAVDGSAEVVGLVRNLAGARRRFARHAQNPRLTLIDDDLCVPLAFSRRFDMIIHGASQASPKYYLTDPVGTMKPNLLGTFQLLERARADSSEAFLFISSGEVYGQVADGSLIAENAYGYIEPAAVRSCYGESKRAGETLCVAAHHQYGVHATIARPFHTYGPGIKLDDGRVFADFIADIVARRDILVKGDGAARRAFCYVSDAIVGLFTILLKGEAARPYNVGNDEACVSIRELAETLVAAFPERGLKAVFDASKVAPNYATSPIQINCPSVTALRALGWAPRVGIAEGFRRAVAAAEEAAANP